MESNFFFTEREAFSKRKSIIKSLQPKIKFKSRLFKEAFILILLNVYEFLILTEALLQHSETRHTCKTMIMHHASYQKVHI